MLLLGRRWGEQRAHHETREGTATRPLFWMPPPQPGQAQWLAGARNATITQSVELLARFHRGTEEALKKMAAGIDQISQLVLIHELRIKNLESGQSRPRVLSPGQVSSSRVSKTFPRAAASYSGHDN